MTLNPLYIFGAGGHGKVVIDIAERCKFFSIKGVLDDDSALHGHSFFDYLVIGGRERIAEIKTENTHFIVAIGNNRIRRNIYEEFVSLGIAPACVVHPSANLARQVDLSGGTVVMANVAINSSTTVGANVIINTSASIDHDCVVEDSVHIAPGVIVCGGVRVGEGSFIGAGATIVPGISIGRNSIIGAGATVVSDVPEGCTVMGTPAKPRLKK